jgi:two-component system, NtrC family, response regulator AtoC
VPPLRERRDDIPGLVEYFVQRYSREFGVAERQLAPGILQAFLSYPWPGNIRELENFIKRMLVLRDWTLARTLVAPRAASTVPVVAPASPSVSPASIDSTGRSLKEISRQAVLEAEREVIARALEQCRWNRVKTAKMLKISYRALLYKIKDMGLRQDRAAS